MIWEMMRTRTEELDGDRRSATPQGRPEDLLEMLDEEARYYAGRETPSALDERNWRAELESEA